MVQNIGPNAIEIILSEMGKKTGAPTIAQDKASSVVWGMPGEAVKLGAVDGRLPLKKNMGKIVSMVKS